MSEAALAMPFAFACARRASRRFSLASSTRDASSARSAEAVTQTGAVSHRAAVDRPRRTSASLYARVRAAACAWLSSGEGGRSVALALEGSRAEDGSGGSGTPVGRAAARVALVSLAATLAASVAARSAAAAPSHRSRSASLRVSTSGDASDRSMAHSSVSARTRTSSVSACRAASSICMWATKRSSGGGGPSAFFISASAASPLLPAPAARLPTEILLAGTGLAVVPSEALSFSAPGFSASGLGSSSTSLAATACCSSRQARKATSVATPSSAG